MSENYYVPEGSYWPFVGSVGIFFALFGVASWLNEKVFGPYCFIVGMILLITMMAGWFHEMFKENKLRLSTGAQVERSFKIGMLWFLFTEAMLFFGLFAALLYSRYMTVAWLSGGGPGQIGTLTHFLLWPHFKEGWPVFHTPNPAIFKGPKSATSTWHIPLANTFVILFSGIMVWLSKRFCLRERYGVMKLTMFLAFLCAVTFIILQCYEYMDAYTVHGLTLMAGIYGSLFFMITGFDAAHVLVGGIMLLIIFIRMCNGTFTSENHFAIRAISWYWYFVVVIWLLVFILVYWM